MGSGLLPPLCVSACKAEERAEECLAPMHIHAVMWCCRRLTTPILHPERRPQGPSAFINEMTETQTETVPFLPGSHPAQQKNMFSCLFCFPAEAKKNNNGRNGKVWDDTWEPAKVYS
ncbi:hypothetical protein FQN60_000990 [Etheostoma spectabile]|uniref:Uncharacterized protein n=1 Tax=Etheostoma spectabile TaxID=54343 RepID=A0A5J5D1D8_9PERO|nr:hypothetical protein FQN60_000990 [Etheostoma spectabile]